MAAEVRIGMVGAGSVARRHAVNLGALAGVRIAGVADLDAGAASDLADQAGAPAYAGHEELIQAQELDGLYVCVPPFAHGPPERAAVAADLPFFVEKPVALDLATAEEIGAAIAGRGLITATGYHLRHLDVADRAAALLEGRPVRLVVAAWLDKVPPVGWWLDESRSGGQIVEQATHVIDLARHLVGEIEEVHAVQARRDAVADASVATLRFAGGAVGSLSATFVLAAKHRAGLTLAADGLALELSETELVVDRGDGAPEVHAGDLDAARRAVDEAFVAAVRGDASAVRTPYDEALRTHRVGRALTRSAQQGRPVVVAQGGSGA